MKKKKVYDGKNFSVSLYYIEIEGKRIKQEIIEQRRGVIILALEGEKIILVKQYRFPCGYILEVPGGTLKKMKNQLNVLFVN